MVCGLAIGTAQEPARTPLSAALLREDASALAAAARSDGVAVRGAILFAQSSLGCASCHAQGATDLVGPDLTRVDASRKDVHFVQAILRPSEDISRGYESSKVLTGDGRLIVGRILRQDVEQIVLREATGKKTLVTIAKDDVEQVQLETTSAMPSDLVDRLENRQQFLDLVKYVMDIANTESTLGVAVGSGRSPAEELDPRIKGMAMIDPLRLRQLPYDGRWSDDSRLIVCRQLCPAQTRTRPRISRKARRSELHQAIHLGSPFGQARNQHAECDAHA